MIHGSSFREANPVRIMESLEVIIIIIMADLVMQLTSILVLPGSLIVFQFYKLLTLLGKSNSVDVAWKSL